MSVGKRYENKTGSPTRVGSVGFLLERDGKYDFFDTRQYERNLSNVLIIIFINMNILLKMINMDY